MFDDFSQSEISSQARKRFRSSIAAAVLVYGSSGAAIVAATASVRHAVQEELTQVEFAPPPEPPPPPPPVVAAPPPKPLNTLRPKVKRPTLAPPDVVPLDKPKESEAELAKADEAGPVDGFLDGVEGGTGTGHAPAAPPAPPAPPPPKVEAPLVAGVAINGDEHPKYPKAALRKGIEGTVVVAFDVLEDGSCANPKIMSGPEEFHELVLRSVLTWRYRPATRGGKPVRWHTTKKVTFRLEDA